VRIAVSVSPPDAVVLTVVVAGLPATTVPDAGLADRAKSVSRTTVA
jgi:hypothetical protein